MCDKMKFMSFKNHRDNMHVLVSKFNKTSERTKTKANKMYWQIPEKSSLDAARFESKKIDSEIRMKDLKKFKIKNREIEIIKNEMKT